jgi:hypothetical protein
MLAYVCEQAAPLFAPALMRPRFSQHPIGDQF